MRVSILILSILLVIAFGCTTGSEERVVSKLDRQEGIESFVVGDSLYPTFQKEIRRKEGTVEYSLLNSVVTPYREIDSPQRFLFELEVKGVSARSNGGRISAISISLGDLTPRRQQQVTDSLTNRYGKPTSTLDTTLSAGLDFEIRRWKGEQVWLQETKVRNDSDSTKDQKSVLLRVINHGVIEQTRRLRQTVDSLFQERAAGSVKQVGEFPLLSTRTNPMVEAERREYSWTDSMVTEHTVPYEHLKGFFGFANPMRPSQEERVITAEASYDQDTDSLNSLTVSIYGEKYDPDGRGMLDRSAYKGAEEVTEVLREKLDEPHLVIQKSEIPIGEEEIKENEVRYWYCPPVLVRQAPSDILGGVYEEGVSITFSRVEGENPQTELEEAFWTTDFLHHSWK